MQGILSKSIFKKSNAFSGLKTNYLKFQDLIKLILFFGEIFWTVKGRVPFCELSFTVWKHVLAKNQSHERTVWLYCLTTVFEVKSSKITSKRLFRPYLVSQAVTLRLWFITKIGFRTVNEVAKFGDPNINNSKNIAKKRRSILKSLTEIYIWF